MYEEYQNLKKYNENKIINILINSNLTLKDKELQLEKNLIFNISQLLNGNTIYI